jgi:hypothetical protein
MLMLALASAENMVAATPLRLAICRPTAASTQQSSIFSTLLMRPALMASANLRAPPRRPGMSGCPGAADHAPGLDGVRKQAERRAGLA